MIRSKRLWLLPLLLGSTPLLAETYKTIYNPFAGHLDYVTKVDSTTLPSGSTQYIQASPSSQQTTAFNTSSGTVAALNLTTATFSDGTTQTTAASSGGVSVYPATSTIRASGGITVATVTATSGVSIGTSTLSNELYILNRSTSPIVRIEGPLNASGQGGKLRFTEVGGSGLDTGIEWFYDSGSDKLKVRFLADGVVETDDIVVIPRTGGFTLPALNVLNSATQLYCAELSGGNTYTGCTKGSAMAVGNYIFVSNGVNAYFNGDSSGETGFRLGNSNKFLVKNSGGVSIGSYATGTDPGADNMILPGWFLVGSNSRNAGAEFQVGGGTFVATVNGHWESKISTTPTVSACGTNPSMQSLSTDVSGFINTGTGIFTSCTLTFLNQWANKPSCVIEDDSNVLASPPKVATTPTTLIISGVTITPGDVINYMCLGNQ